MRGFTEALRRISPPHLRAGAHRGVSSANRDRVGYTDKTVSWKGPHPALPKDGEGEGMPLSSSFRRPGSDIRACPHGLRISDSWSCRRPRASRPPLSSSAAWQQKSRREICCQAADDETVEFSGGEH